MTCPPDCPVARNRGKALTREEALALGINPDDYAVAVGTMIGSSLPADGEGADEPPLLPAGPQSVQLEHAGNSSNAHHEGEDLD